MANTKQTAWTVKRKVMARMRARARVAGAKRAAEALDSTTEYDPKRWRGAEVRRSVERALDRGDLPPVEYVEYLERTAQGRNK